MLSVSRLPVPPEVLILNHWILIVVIASWKQMIYRYEMQTHKQQRRGLLHFSPQFQNNDDCETLYPLIWEESVNYYDWI